VQQPILAKKKKHGSKRNNVMCSDSARITIPFRHKSEATMLYEKFNWCHGKSKSVLVLEKRCRLSYLTRGIESFHKSTHHLKITGARRTTGNKFHTEGSKILSATVQYLDAMMTRRPGFVHPCLKLTLKYNTYTNTFCLSRWASSLRTTTKIFETYC
jgi:hypothetical protein